MRRSLFVAVALTLVAVSVHAQVSPSAQSDSILKDYDKAYAAYAKAIEGATGVAEQGKIFREQNPQPAAALRLLELAKQHPKDPVAYRSLVWIVENSEFGPAAEKPYTQAIQLLATQYADHKDNEKLLERMAQSPFASSGRFLQAVFDKHPSTIVRGRAGFHLGLYLKNYCATVDQVRINPEMAKNVEHFVGPELFKQLKDNDNAKLLARADEVFARVQKEYPLIAYKKTNLAKAADAELFDLRNLTVGKIAPDIEGEDIDGKKFKLSDYRGKVVVVVFWGTWCPHCMAMVPQERALVKRYAGQPFAILGVNSDERGEKLTNAVAKKGITWRSFWDGGNSQGPIATRWNVQGWPAVYVIDGKGVIRFRHVRDEMLDEAVAVLMKEASPKR